MAYLHSQQVVYERIAGGWGRERRYIYWNAHYYGENFYGWSIGDEKSLFESGPFHSQGELRGPYTHKVS